LSGSIAGNPSRIPHPPLDLDCFRQAEPSSQ
jgi:hypothetical protein